MVTPEPTTWTIHLAARRPRLAAAVLVAIALGLAGIHALGAPALVLLLAALLLLGSVAEFLLPVTYTLDADGAHARHFGSHRILPWPRVRRVYLLPDGINLSPLTTPGWAESYRGVMLRTPDRAAVLVQVHAWLAANEVVAEEVENGWNG